MNKLPDNETLQALAEPNAKRRIILPDGTPLPQLGQGTWNMGDAAASRKEELETLRLGVELGMTLLDTAEMYRDGRSEELVGEAIKGIRDKVFLVSKVYPHNAGGARLVRSCEASLKRLGVEQLDLYLLHWRGSIPLEETVEGMEKLVRQGKIARWGVSNLDTADMRELLSLTGGIKCAVNQVLYHLGSRGIEHELLPFLEDRGIPVMAYCPLAQGGSLRKGLTAHPVVQAIAGRHQVTPLQVLLAWCIRSSNVLAIPKASSVKHVLENASAAALELLPEELAGLDQAFPAPGRKVPLDMV
ncbi:MAG: hypothetical protein K0Q90_3181 [Paenibacillaceae bacterium]|jgi:diketogulonate reductase-like aldo/keto reductase|nr:hypothetical protein [Paenibacillaceae bacterium]